MSTKLKAAEVAHKDLKKISTILGLAWVVTSEIGLSIAKEVVKFLPGDLLTQSGVALVTVDPLISTALFFGAIAVRVLSWVVLIKQKD